MPTVLTVLTDSESTATTVTFDLTETEADTMEPSTHLAAVTIPATDAVTIEVPTTVPALLTQMATTDSSIAPTTILDKSSLTIALQPIVSTMIPQKENLTMIESGIKTGWCTKIQNFFGFTF